MSLLMLLPTLPLAIFGLYKLSHINKTTHQRSLSPSPPPSPLLPTLPTSPIFSPLPSSPVFFTASPTAFEESRRPYARRCNVRSRPTKRSGRSWELWCEKQKSTRGARVGEKRRRGGEKGGRGGKRRRDMEEEGSVVV